MIQRGALIAQLTRGGVTYPLLLGLAISRGLTGGGGTVSQPLDWENSHGSRGGLKKKVRPQGQRWSGSHLGVSGRSLYRGKLPWRWWSESHCQLGNEFILENLVLFLQINLMNHWVIAFVSFLPLLLLESCSGPVSPPELRPGLVEGSWGPAGSQEGSRAPGEVARPARAAGSSAQRLFLSAFSAIIEKREH